MTITNLDQIQDTDLLACTDTDGVTYSVTGAQFKELLGPPPAPWDDAAGIYHVILQSSGDISVTGQSKIYNLNTEQEVSYITGAGEWIITGSETRFTNSTGNWQFGDLTDTSNVTNMYNMFGKANVFNTDISDWEVGNVTNMSNMFICAGEFNSDISDWNVGNVTNMANMFKCSVEFNSDISEWDVGNVTDMKRTFSFAKGFNSDLSDWDVSNVTDMAGMFRDAWAFNGDMSGWKGSNVTNMSNMFLNAIAFNSDISDWDVGNATKMYNMFRNAQAFNSDISDWDVANVTRMDDMFNMAQAFNSDISDWDVSNVGDMNNMFGKAKVFNQDLTTWCVSKIPQPGPSSFNGGSAMPQDDSYNPKWGTCPLPWEIHDGGVFHVKNAGNLVTLGSGPYQAYDVNGNDIGMRNKLNVGEEFVFLTGKDAHGIFAGQNQYETWEFGDLTDTSKVTNMLGLFKQCYKFNSDISGWDTSNVTTMEEMFYYAREFNQDLSQWCVTQVTSAGQRKFANNTDAWDKPKPEWGTCPRGEDKLSRSVETFNYTVTVANTGYGNKYYLDGNEQQSLDAIVGDTIVFDQSDATNTGHPLRIYTDEARTTEYTTGVTVNGTTITFVVSETCTFYYQCQAHAGMGGEIIVL